MRLNPYPRFIRRYGFTFYYLNLLVQSYVDFVVEEKKKKYHPVNRRLFEGR